MILSHMKTEIILKNKKITLVGTAHVSSQSVDEVIEACLEIQPDCVAIELDEERYQSMMNPTKWANTDIVKIIKDKKVAFLLSQMILSSYQRKIAKQFELKPGDEIKAAINYANEKQITIEKIDRSIQVTLLRIWHSLGFVEKSKLISELISSLFEQDIKEEDIENLKQQDLLQSALKEVEKQFPQITNTLIDERDRILAEKLRRSKGENIVAVVGAAHVPGILKYIEKSSSISDLLKKPSPKKMKKVTQWIIPIFIVGLILITILKQPEVALNTLLKFLVVNGSLAALGTALALGHPLSILTAFVMAPIGILSPFLATGWFAGLVEAWVHKPKVDDFMNLADDVLHVKGYWKNRVARILLVVMFANLFTSFGTLFYSFDLIKNLFN